MSGALTSEGFLEPVSDEVVVNEGEAQSDGQQVEEVVVASNDD